MVILGIDGGLQGGLALIETAQSGNPCLTMKSIMPVMKITDTKHELYIDGIVRLIEQWRPDQVALEFSQAMPKQGVTTCHTIGKNWGILRGIIGAMKIPLTVVHPRTWQKAIHVNCGATKDTKKKSALICSRLFPGIDWRASEKCKKDHDGMQEAALLAVWLHRLLNGEIK